ncbi:ketopantoate reductase PanE/ApbA-domain-containing protein [Xylariales sp. PMI_506]|nr:ketopantoate reductase PanE/ApbA-domain-containing protein [Xylariales sp. PMI_506]
MGDSELIEICSVGGNAVSAFLSWRLQATNACDVTLVWKSGFDAVHQYGISFKSASFGNERFKPRHVVRTPDEAAQNKEGPFDYVILCIKALPDVYDLASVIDSVVTPQHTCILINTTQTLGVEAAIEERFPTNVVLSLVSNAEITQLGPSEFEHKGSTEIWVGPANKNGNIPYSIQEDMAQALAMTLSTGRVDCKVSPNIRQQQFERVIGPIAFHPASVIFDTPNHGALLEKTGVRQLVSDVIDELLQLAATHGCRMSEDFKDSAMKEQCQATLDGTTIMWQDYVARRPMEVETYLGSPVKLAQASGIKIPRVETLYSILHNLNITNQARPKEANGLPMVPGSPAAPMPGPRMSNVPPPRNVSNGIPNGMGRPRPRNGSNFTGPPPGMRRGPPPSMNGAPPNGYRPQSRQPSRRGSLDDTDLGEFSHLVLYDDIAAGGDGGFPGDNYDLEHRERDMQMRQRDMALREQEFRMRRGPPGPGPGPRRRPPPRAPAAMYDDDDEEGDYFDPNALVAPSIDPEQVDMMSMTSRKNRAKPSISQSQMRNDPDFGSGVIPARNSRFGRPGFGRNRSSVMNSVGPNHENILDDPLLSYSSNRYGDVDRGQMHMNHVSSRANSLTAQHLDQLNGPGGMGGPYPRRASQSPGNPYTPSIRGGNGRPSPPNGFGGQGRPSPPNGVRQPVPRYPPGQGNAVAPQQVEQRVGVSNLQPPRAKNVRSLTGSASASAGSGESTQLDSEPSAHSSQSSLGPQAPIGVR